MNIWYDNDDGDPNVQFLCSVPIIFVQRHDSAGKKALPPDEVETQPLEDLRSVPVPSEPEPVVSPELSTEERRTKYQKIQAGDQEENGNENGEKKDKTDKPCPGMKSNPKGKKTELFTESEDEAGLTGWPTYL